MSILIFQNHPQLSPNILKTTQPFFFSRTRPKLAKKPILVIWVPFPQHQDLKDSLELRQAVHPSAARTTIQQAFKQNARAVTQPNCKTL